jgi:hypothetical protein
MNSVKQGFGLGLGCLILFIAIGFIVLLLAALAPS